MHDLESCLAGSRRGQLLAHIVFNSLYIVVRARFDGLHRCGGIRIRLVRELARARDDFGVERGAGKLRNGRRQVQQPLRLDPNALADQSGFGEKVAQWLGGRTVAAIYRRKCVDG